MFRSLITFATKPRFAIPLPAPTQERIAFLFAVLDVAAVINHFLISL